MPRKKKPTAESQIEGIESMFNAMPVEQQQAFLLGRIYTCLQIGNAFADTFNDVIKNSEKALNDLEKKRVEKDDNK